FETAALIRKYKRSAHTPIIFITAYADEIQTAKGYSLGAVDYILSPVVPEVLRSKVKVFVELHQMQRRVRRQADERVALVASEAARRVAEENDRRSNFLSHASRGLSGAVAVPLMIGERVLGVLMVGAEQASPGHAGRDWAALEELASRAAIAFENAHLYRSLQYEIMERRTAEAELQEANQRKDEFLAML